MKVKVFSIELPTSSKIFKVQVDQIWIKLYIYAPIFVQDFSKHIVQ